MATLWLVDPATLPKPSAKTRKIGRKPLIDLAGLQAAIHSGALDDEDVWLATLKCENNVQDLSWSMRHLLDCLRCLKPLPRKSGGDFKNSEWCLDSTGRWRACDAYAIRYDETRRCRSSAGLEFFLKFSIDENGALTLVMISAHL